MGKNNEWQQRGLIATDADGPAANGNSWWTCWYPNTWHDGKCQRRTRYLGESCWDGWFGNGACVGSETSYDEYSTACYRGKCLPFAVVQERNECECAWLGWNFIVAC